MHAKLKERVYVSGIVAGKPLAQLSPAQVRKTFEVNTFAHFWTVQSALPSLKRAKQALIVSVSSVVRMDPSAFNHNCILRW